MGSNGWGAAARGQGNDIQSCRGLCLLMTSSTRGKGDTLLALDIIVCNEPIDSAVAGKQHALIQITIDQFERRLGIISSPGPGLGGGCLGRVGFPVTAVVLRTMAIQLEACREALFHIRAALIAQVGSCMLAGFVRVRVQEGW